MEGKYHLSIDPEVPPVVHAPRKVPIALKERLKDELDRLEGMDVITPVTEPTPWVSSLVMVVKKGKIRVCIDPKDLNKALKRSHYPSQLLRIFSHTYTRPRSSVFWTLEMAFGTWNLPRKAPYLQLSTRHSVDTDG